MLDLGLTPNISRVSAWRLDVYGALEHPIFWDFKQFTAEPQTQFVSDIHCVTTWSRYDNRWKGFRPAISRRLPAARGSALRRAALAMTATHQSRAGRFRGRGRPARP